MLTQDDRSTLEKRRKHLRHLPTVTWLLPGIWLAVCAVTFVRYPLIANPWRVLEGVRNRDFSRTTLESLCLLTPFAVLLVQVVVILFLVLGLTMFHRERRLLRIIEGLAREDEGREP